MTNPIVGKYDPAPFCSHLDPLDPLDPGVHGVMLIMLSWLRGAQLFRYLVKPHEDVTYHVISCELYHIDSHFPTLYIYIYTSSEYVCVYIYIPSPQTFTK